MSARHLTAVADLDDIPPTCKLVLYGAAFCAGPTGFAAVDNARLKQLTGLSERSIRAQWAKLERLGLARRINPGIQLTLPNLPLF